MRAELLTYLTANLTASIKTSQELPFDQGGNALYLKNMKRVYISEPIKEQSVLVPILSEEDICQTVTTVQGYLAVDAKNRTADLDSALATMANAKLVNTITDSFRKEFDYTASIDNDILLFEFEYRFYNIA